ncbi:MAG: exodeoxyribonuclease VII small subunit [Acutalibacteraceae bacterium]
MKQYKSYEQASSRLEEIVKSLENDELTLEQSLALFEEGTQITGFCYSLLKQAEQKITEISAEETADE